MKPKIEKITDSWIRQNQDCQEIIDWYDKTKRNPMIILEKLIVEKKYLWANWFIVRIMQYQDYLTYACFAAEQVLPIFEEKYPDDQRPRKAIEAARKYIKRPTFTNKEKAEAAARRAAAAGAIETVVGMAEGAAWAAARAAWATAGTTEAVARAAARAAALAATEAAGKGLWDKILNYGMNLLKE